ncbi:MAG: hypothetical protein WCE97_01525 [Candidatus Cybelea sp.]
MTRREGEVVRLAIEGKSNREIAELRTHGRDAHRRDFDRFDLTSRRQLAALVDA